MNSKCNVKRGKNATAISEDVPPIPDLSVLRKSIATSVTGISQACKVFETGTLELKQLLSSECDIIYECRVCRNLFRSLANFISHKRIYCCEKFNSSSHPHFSNNNYVRDDINAILKNESDYQEFVKDKEKWISDHKQNYVSNYQKKGAACKDLTSIIDKLLQKTESEKNESTDANLDDKGNRIQTNSEMGVTVFQNVVSNNQSSQDSIREHVAELDRMISSNEGILGSDGKLLITHCSESISEQYSNNPSISDSAINDILRSKNELICKICKITFSSLKTKRFHIKHKHTNNRLVYACPDCTDTFSNSWSVFRHLVKIHRKSTTHIRKLRDTIQNKAYKLDTTLTKHVKRNSVSVVSEPLSEQQRIDQENQAWIDNLEGDGDIPRCGGCGKRFERRAALRSHRQTCQLRKSAQNRLNLQKKIIVKSINSKDTIELLEPIVKITKLERTPEKCTEKPLEKRIEIKIRKDYNKTSPASIRTNSPCIADEDVVMENADSLLGENKCDVIPNVDVVNEEITETVKDCDDANVDFDEYVDVMNNGSKEINEEESDMNVENCDMIVDKACGQNDKSENDSNGFKGFNVGNNDDFLMDEGLKYGYDNVDFTESVEYSCDYCSEIFLKKRKLKKHIAIHLASAKYEYELCEVKNLNVNQCNEHANSQHHLVYTSQSNIVSKISLGDTIEFGNNKNKVADNQVAADGSEGNEDSNNTLRNAKPKKSRYASFVAKKKKERKCFIKLKKSSKKKPLILDKLKISLQKDAKNESDTDKKITLPLNDQSNLNSVIEDQKLKNDCEKSDQHIASSESYTVRRPVRNRTKLLDKDFEYDSSYFTKIKPRPKENAVLTPKSHLKRKQFLQNDGTARKLQREEPTILKSHHGILQSMSLNAATLGRAHMRTKQLVITRKNIPGFVKTVSALSTGDHHRETTSELSLSGTEKTRVPAPPKIISLTSLSQLSTTSQKSYLENAQKAGHRTYPSAKKTPMQQHSMPTLPTNVMIDHQALNDSEITMLSKSECRLLDKNDDSSEASLSILPTNSPDSTFVNISLQQLKELQNLSTTVADAEIKVEEMEDDVSKTLLEDKSEVNVLKILSHSENNATKIKHKEKSTAPAYTKYIPKKYKNFQTTLKDTSFIKKEVEANEGSDQSPSVDISNMTNEIFIKEEVMHLVTDTLDSEAHREILDSTSSVVTNM